MGIFGVDLVHSVTYTGSERYTESIPTPVIFNRNPLAGLDMKGRKTGSA